MTNNNIFNPKALEKFRSPDKLDTMIRITGPVGWMGLASVAVLCFAIVLWSIFGSFTEKADGQGLLLDSAGVTNVTHTASGKVTGVYVKPGDRVKRGQLVAHMEQPEQSADTRMAEYGTGLATDDRDMKSRAYQYDAKRHTQAARENIICDYDGVVNEVMVREGQNISAGDPLCSVRLTQDREDMTGVFYIPLNKGKRVEPGMTIQLVPNGIDDSQDGNLIGVVKSVSQYPISAQGVSKSLGNSQLAQYVLNQQSGAAVEVKFELVKDPDSESGYLWTSVVGRHRPVTPGSFCTGYIVIERQPPIEKVFYKISQWLRSR